MEEQSRVALAATGDQKSNDSQSSTSSLLTTPYRRLGPQGYEHCDWQGVQNYEKAVRVFDALVSPTNPSPAFPVYISGSVGTGKTGLAAVLYRLAKRPIWRRADSFLLDLSMGRMDDTYKSEIRKAGDASLLVLDDLGIRKPSEGMVHLFFDLLELRKSKATIITSNKTIDEIAEHYTDGRIYSRLSEGTLLHIRGEDRRSKPGGLTVFTL